MDEVDDWLAMLERQHRVVSRAQLLARGFTDEGIAAQLDAGRWQRVHDGVYALFTGPLTPEARWSAALSACRGEALLSHETAGEIHGFVDADPQRPIHVTVRYGTSAMRTDGLRVHRSRAFAHIGVPGVHLPRTSRVHTVLDLVAAAGDPSTATSLAHQLALDAHVSPFALERAVELRRPPRYRRALLDAVALLRDGVLSALERSYALDVERAHGLPDGRRQGPVLVDGVRRFEDVVYDLPRGRAVVRLDGFRYHRDRATAVTDRRRAVSAALAGMPSLPFGWEEVHGDPCRTAREVAAILRPGGWQEPLVGCARCCA